MSWRTLAAALAALLVPGCSVTNESHCFFQGGDAVCTKRDPDRPYCSKCVGENDGCVVAPVTDENCAVPATGGGATTTGPATGSSSTGAPTTSGTPMETTGTGGMSGTTGPGTTGPGTTGPDTTGTTDMTSGTGSTGGGPMCGDGMREGQEACDGEDFGNVTCLDFGMGKFGGGMLKCSRNCTIDTSMCCLVEGQACGLDTGKCCSNNCVLTCQPKP